MSETHTNVPEAHELFAHNQQSDGKSDKRKDKILKFLKKPILISRAANDTATATYLPSDVQNQPQGPPPDFMQQNILREKLILGDDTIESKPGVSKDADKLTSSSIVTKTSGRKGLKDKTNINQNQNKPEVIAKNRTSEFMMRLMASFAVRLAIKSPRPERQGKKVKAAEVNYMSALWLSKVKQELQV